MFSYSPRIPVSSTIFLTSQFHSYEFLWIFKVFYASRWWRNFINVYFMEFKSSTFKRTILFMSSIKSKNPFQGIYFDIIFTYNSIIFFSIRYRFDKSWFWRGASIRTWSYSFKTLQPWQLAFCWQQRTSVIIRNSIKRNLEAIRKLYQEASWVCRQRAWMLSMVWGGLSRNEGWKWQNYLYS